MTDPFKNQRYSYNANINDLGSPPGVQHNPMNKYNDYLYKPSGDQPMTTTMDATNLSNLASSNNKQEFYQAYIHANRDAIKQLKSNIELLFKGAK